MASVEVGGKPRVAGQFCGWASIFWGRRGWPSRGSGAGLFDTCGFLNRRARKRRGALVGEAGGVRGRPSGDRWRAGRAGRRGVEHHWNWQGDPRTALPVDVYANCEAVELFLNGQSLGRKSGTESTNCLFSWNVPFKAGELKAVGTRGGQTVEDRLRLPALPARLDLVADRTQLAADGRDVAHMEVRLVDAKGGRVPNADVLCTAKVTGAGQLLGLDNGDQRDMTALKSADAPHTAGAGAGAGAVGARGQTGDSRFDGVGPGLPEAKIAIRTE